MMTADLGSSLGIVPGTRTPPARARMALWALAASTVLTIGCGDELGDTDFGGVDLAPFYTDTSENFGPTQRRPGSYAKIPGFLDGRIVDYYDFGNVYALQTRPSDEQMRLFQLADRAPIPKAAPVNPMYFFFDSKGNPLFSRPVREAKTGNFYIRGGQDVRNPNPAANADKKVAYPIRQRDLLRDPNRNNSADYQRPIVDKLMDLPTETDDRNKFYSGLWEFVRVTAPSGYAPDEIKSWRTLEKNSDRFGGDFKVERTGLVINCPFVDARTVIIPTVYAHEEFGTRIPQPRMELWYRKKKVDCYLVNGWETLGRTDLDPEKQGNDKYVLYKNNEDARRVGTLDAETLVIGEGVTEKRETISPVGRFFLPHITARDEENWISGGTHLTTGALPRGKLDDPTGYRPVRWWWNIEVQDVAEIGVEFDIRWYSGQAGLPALNDLAKIDGTKVVPRRLASRDNIGMVRNLAYTGREISCLPVEDARKAGKEYDPATDACPQLGLVCGPRQETSVARCEPRKARYLEYCAATVASCWNRIDVTRTEAVKGARVEAGVMVPADPDYDPAHTGKVRILHRGDVIEEWFINGIEPPPLCGTEEKGKPCIEQDLITHLNEAVSPELRQKRADQGVTIRYPDSAGATTTFACLGDNQIGHCYYACDGQTINNLQGETEVLTVKERGEDRDISVSLDSRCGGRLMPGYRCLPITNETNESGGRVCVRDCDKTLPIATADAMCQSPTPLPISDFKQGKDSKLFSPYYFDIAQNTRCLDLQAGSLGPAFDSCVRDIGAEPL